MLGVLALVGAGTGAVGRAIRARFSATESRANVVLPRPSDPLAPHPDAVSVDVDGVSSFFTPNADFYRIDTALTVPAGADRRLRAARSPAWSIAS